MPRISLIDIDLDSLFDELSVIVNSVSEKPIMSPAQEAHTEYLQKYSNDNRSFILRAIEQDATGVTAILSRNAAFRRKMELQLTTLYKEKASWKSDTTIIFLNKTIPYLKQLKLEAEEKLRDLDKTCIPGSEPITGIKRAISSLTDFIVQCEDTLAERNYALHSDQCAEITSFIRSLRDENLLYDAAMQSFPAAIALFKSPDALAKISNSTIFLLFNEHKEKGVERFSGIEFAKLVEKELVNRLKNGTLNASDNSLSSTNTWLYDRSVLKLEHAIRLELSWQKDAFMKIYDGLYKGQSSLFKRNDINSISTKLPTEFIQDVKTHSLKYPNSRTAKAWELTQVHYLSCSDNNIALFSEMYKWSFEKSGLFKKSHVKGTTFFSSASLNDNLGKVALTSDDIKNSKGSRTENIVKALRK